jgi:predicted MFS family arabinose efflux permease
MSATPQLRRVVGFFLLAAVLLAVLTPGAASLPLAILVVTLWFLIAIAPTVLLFRFDEQSHRQQALSLPDFLPRPPPAL